MNFDNGLKPKAAELVATMIKVIHPILQSKQSFSRFDFWTRSASGKTRESWSRHGQEELTKSMSWSRNNARLKKLQINVLHNSI